MRSWQIILLIAIVGFLAAISGWNMLYIIFYVLVCIFLCSWPWAYVSFYKLKFHRLAGTERLQVGEIFEECLALDNDSWLPKLWVQIEDASTLPGHRIGTVMSIGRRKRTVWQAKSVCRQRGSFQLGPVTAASGDPFGIFRQQRILAPAHEILVLPCIYPIEQLEMPVGDLSGGNRNARRTWQATINAATVRNYVTGDPLNRIHWRSTARQGALMVKEFEQDPVLACWILLDLQRSSAILEEHKVSIAASIAHYLLRKGFPVGLVINAQQQECLPLDNGDRQCKRILDSLALAKAGGESNPNWSTFSPISGLNESEAPFQHYQLPIINPLAENQPFSYDCLFLPDKKSIAFCHFGT